MMALIFCAGLGTRLGEITKTIPKCMVEVAGKPVLERIADRLTDFGARKIIVNLHYLPEKIMDYFGNRFLYFYEPELLGEVKTISALKEWLSRDMFFAVNGDTLSNVDFGEMGKLHMAQGRAPATSFMVGDVHAGTWLFEPGYFSKRENVKKMASIRANRFYQDDGYFFDIGTRENLEKAIKFYEEEETLNLPNL